MNESFNNLLVLVVGYSATGKSASLRNIQNQDKWMYLNAESGKRLPFKNKFDSYIITDPYQVHEAFDFATDNDNVQGIVLESITFLMDMFESQYVIDSPNTMKAWADFAQFYRVLMLSKVPMFGKPVIISAHVKDELDEKNMEMKTYVPIKGSTKNTGVESNFSTVIASKKVPLKDLKGYSNSMLNITEEEEMLGFKYVFQTRLTKSTTGERIRSPMDMFSKEETFIDNDCQLLLNRLSDFYKN